MKNTIRENRIKFEEEFLKYENKNTLSRGDELIDIFLIPRKINYIKFINLEDVYKTIGSYRNTHFVLCTSKAKLIIDHTKYKRICENENISYYGMELGNSWDVVG